MRLIIYSFIDHDMFVRYLGGGIGHGENTIDMETPAAPNNEPGDSSDNQLGKEVNGEVASESKDEDVFDDDSKRDVEYGDSDDNESEVEL